MSILNRSKEENNRIRKTRDFFKKTRDNKGTFHAKMSTIKNRNCMKILRGGGKNTEFSSVTRLCLTLCDPMDCSMPGFPEQNYTNKVSITQITTMV